MNESWRDIPGYEGLYRVSDAGRVASSPRNGTLGGTLKPDTLRLGYCQVKLYRGNVGTVYKVHRLVLLAFVGPSEKDANHKNGVRSDNRLDNLEYVTAKENTAHAMKRRGKWQPGGEDSPTAKLSENDVETIRTLRGQLTQREIARKYQISEAQVSRIVNNQRWSK